MRNQTAPEIRTNDCILSIGQVAEVLGVHVSTVWRWADTGQMPSQLLLGPKRRGWRASDIDAWLANLTAKQQQKTAA